MDRRDLKYCCWKLPGALEVQIEQSIRLITTRVSLEPYPCKKTSTPSRACEETDDKIDACCLYSSHLRFADNSFRDFIPQVTLQKFLLFRSARYRSIIKETILEKDLMYATSVARVEVDVDTLSYEHRKIIGYWYPKLRSLAMRASKRGKINFKNTAFDKNILQLRCFVNDSIS